MMTLSLLISALSLFALFGGKEEAKPLPEKFILAHSLYGTMNDVNTVNSLFAQFMPPKLSLYGFLQSLHAAKNDDRVQSLVIKIHDGDYSLTQIQTIREAIIDFKTSGKKTYIYTDNFGGFSNGLGEYWLASAFDEIWVQPIGLVSLNGIRIEQPFFEDALDKIGVDFEMESRKAYKTGPEMYLRNDMSPENRETIQAIIDDVMQRITDDIESSRQIASDKLKSAIDNSPLILDEADNLGLIDKIGYLDELEDVLKGEDFEDKDNVFIGLSRYKNDAISKIKFEKGAPKIAIVNINGAIMDAEALASINHPMTSIIPSDIADAKIIAASIQAAADSDDIKVIILRVNSPGGSPTASETIRRAVVRAKEKGKYIIVSMADMAASGGYWIAVNADHIIASDLTLTGSIGVYGGKPDLSGLWDKLGVSWGVVEYGQNAGMWSTAKGMSASEKKRLNIMMDRVYEAFTSRVAEGREMTVEQVEQVAQGRAWTGIDAATGGLVDELGGFEIALRHAAQQINSEHGNWQTMPLAIYPRDEDPFDDILKLLGIPSIMDMPKLPLATIPALFDDAIVTAPMLDINF